MPYPEIWEDVAGYEGLYQVSNLGNVKSLGHNAKAGIMGYKFYHGKNLKPYPCKTRKGYLYVALFKNGHRKQYRVHRLVAESFIPNPFNLPEVNHIDHNVANNSVENLEWCTKEYNLANRRRTGRKKLTE